MQAVSTLPLSPGTPSDLGLGRPCEWYHDLCNFMCASILLHLELFVSFVSYFFFGSFNLSTSFSERFPELWKGKFDDEFPFRTEGSKVSHSLYTCRFLYFSHLLKEVLVPPGKNKTTTIIFDPNLKQAWFLIFRCIRELTSSCLLSLMGEKSVWSLFLRDF